MKLSLLISLITLCSTLIFAKEKDYYFDKRIKIEIVHSEEIVPKSDSLLFAVKVTLSKGWHIYWLNPGDAGEATILEISTNVSNSKIAPFYPIPNYQNTNGIVTFEHKGNVFFPFYLSVPSNFYSDTLEIKLYAKWLACKEKCIPGEAHFKKKFILNKKLKHKDYDKRVMLAFDSIPKDTLAANFEFFEDFALLKTNLPCDEQIKSAFFYPLTEGLFNLERKPEFTVERNILHIKLPFLQYIWGDKSQVEGIVEITFLDRKKKYFWIN